MVALTFLAVALFEFIQFATYGETYGGFIAGLALAASYAADPGALLYAAAMCLFVPLLGAERYRGHPAGPIGACAVIAFPILAFAACWSFLIWKFSGTWPGDLHYSPRAHVFQFPYGVLGGLGRALGSAFADLARSTLYIAAGGLLARAPAQLSCSASACCSRFSRWRSCSGSATSTPPSTRTTCSCCSTIAVVTNHRLMDSPRYATVLVIAAVVQVIIGIRLLPPTTGFTVWQHLMFR